MHSEAPATLKLPEGHGSIDAPSDEHSKPAGHSVQFDALPAAYVPSGQGTANAEAVSGQAWLTGQSVQVARPPTLYFPGSQATIAEVVVLEQAYPAGQAVQFVWLPTLNVPGSHSRGAAAGSSQAYPAAQAVADSVPCGQV